MASEPDADRLEQSKNLRPAAKENTPPAAWAVYRRPHTPSAAIIRR
jgi:hypothetical protein